MASELPPIDPNLRIGAVHLAVSDVARSADFYERVLGLPPISREPDRALLGGDPGRPSLVLVALAHPTIVPVHSTGLFHVAWLHRSREAQVRVDRGQLAGHRLARLLPARQTGERAAADKLEA